MQVDALDGDRSVSPDDWAAEVNKELKENGGGNMSFVTDLANYYLIHLVIACRAQCSICWPYYRSSESAFIVRNPAGRTPQESEPPSPDPIRTEDINSLLDSATNVLNQAALKELVCSIGLVLPTVPLNVV